jgi:hypothetical protein
MNPFDQPFARERARPTPTELEAASAALARSITHAQQLLELSQMLSEFDNSDALALDFIRERRIEIRAEVDADRLLLEGLKAKYGSHWL